MFGIIQRMGGNLTVYIVFIADMQCMCRMYIVALYVPDVQSRSEF